MDSQLHHRFRVKIQAPLLVALFSQHRVRSPDREAKAQEILTPHGAEAVRVHEIEIDKRLQDIPLSALRLDPWLGEEPLGRL